jgi:DNA-directed RNA polymerase I subunit RPA2
LISIFIFILLIFLIFIKDFSKEEIFCRNCQSNTCVKVALPYVLRYLTNELAAMNIKLSFGVEEKQGLE